MVKRSNRLNSFFGENVAPHLISKGSAPEIKKVNDLDKIRKKWDKLQTLLGETVPLKAMLLQKRRKTIDELEEFDENKESQFSFFKETLQAMATAIEDAARLVDILCTFSQMDPVADKNLPEANPARRLSIEVDIEKGSITGPSISEKKIIKLENIFGPDIGVTTLLRQIESQILLDIETLIEHDITNAEYQKILRLDIEKTRNKIHSRVAALSEHCRIID